MIGILKLPSQQTLKDYNHLTKPAPRFSAAVDAQLMNAANITSCPGYQKCDFADG